ncbi:PREDICTED: elicitor peptide 1-like [Camelina sativa]|uniref:Elicitor peptide 1-like n=1 Tax=Camelina sativa TaxID=90675 RepID=A0ABM0XDG9_CAMSA|nr:PREDICTED: elicitor peptide 1-like [Camelina sativa]
MDKSDRPSEEATYLWIPLQCLDQTLKAILRCLGLFHQDSPSSPGTSNQPEEEEEDDVTEKEEVVVTSRGMNVTSRAIKDKANRKGKEGVSSGRRGQTN